MSTPSLIVLDWGTSSLRALLLARDGRVLARRAAPAGILQVPDRDFAGVLARAVEGWPAALPVYAGGMIGSRQGWVEVAYVPCPADLSALAQGIVALEALGRTIRLVPGLACRTTDGVPEVMRGEEVQVLGALPAGGHGLIVLPGTHSKWVLARAGRIERFVTFMTGELFALLKAHSILGRLIEDADDDDEAAFAEGVRRGACEPALSHGLFAARTRALLDELSAAAVASYLSGLLIGAELAAGRRLLGEPATAALLVGESGLVERYRKAAALLGLACAAAPPEAAARGCLALARLRGDLA